MQGTMRYKRQIFYIHGGMTFKNKADYLFYLKNRDVSLEKKLRWSGEYLDSELGDDFDIIRPRMPLADNAKYEEWRIVFERYIPYLKSGGILIGESLGSIFLAKYLSENKLPKRVAGVYLVCPPFDNSLAGEDLVGGFRLGADLSLLDACTKDLRLFFSADDGVVLVAHAEKYRKRLKHARITILEDKNGHFKVSEFPELVDAVRQHIR
jgi:uncharacterized protein